MKYGLTTKQFSILEEVLINPLKKDGATVWIFGSRARGNFREFSDIDILFELKEELKAGTLAHLKEQLEESQLPYKVDVVNLREVAESYRTQILKDRILL